MKTFISRVVLGLVCVSGGLALGCAGRNNSYGDAGYPNAPARTIIAEPGGYEDVYVADQQYTQKVVDGRQVVGYETLSDGTQVEVVTYVHTYPDPIDTFPRVYWGGNWYYNVNGDFVYWNPGYGGWVYYWGPPVPLVSCWNAYYPWAPYYWGVGFYGAGWYWGGVGYYGYHAYGVPVVNEYHHHHHYWADANNGGKPTGGHAGGPADRPPSKGGPADDGPARRIKPDQPPVAERTKPPVGGPTRDGAPARRTAPVRSDDGDRVAGAAPQRDPAKRTVPVRTYTNDSAQRGNTLDPQSGRVASTRNPMAPERAVPARTSKSLGTVQSGPARDPFASRSNTPRWDQPAAAPSRSRDTSWSSGAPSRSSSPSFTPSRDAAPAPSRSFSPPSRSEPSRSFSPPSRSEPSRSYSPPSRSAPSRSMSPPSRSAPSRSMSPPSRSAPSRSYSPPSGGGGSRSFSPSRSSGGGGRSFSPSSGGGRSSGAPTRSSGGGGARRR